MMPGVVAQVTALAHGEQIVVGAVFRAVVQMRDGEHNHRPGDGVWLTVDSLAAGSVIGAALSAALASIVGSLKPDARRYC